MVLPSFVCSGDFQERCHSSLGCHSGGLTYCVPAITNRGGMVNKFTTDGFMALYGAPSVLVLPVMRAQPCKQLSRSSKAWPN